MNDVVSTLFLLAHALNEKRYRYARKRRKKLIVLSSYWTLTFGVYLDHVGGLERQVKTPHTIFRTRAGEEKGVENESRHSPNK